MQVTAPVLPHDERRNRLRRLDDVLEALEQMNLRDERTLIPALEERLIQLGVPAPQQLTPTQLIERVWAIQQPYLVKIVVERRRRRRRTADLSIGS